ncbi:MAG: hypothetical protein HYR60_31455 [Acidobacteria bacterium]|nr:hypothetical protein [Acidobacteriota bacterium]
MLNSSFVPVYLSNEDFLANGAAPAAERAEYVRMWAEFTKLNKGTGNVRVYILAPDGTAFDTLGIGSALMTERLAPFLASCASRLRVQPGDAVVPPKPQPAAPAHGPDSLALHLVARGFRKGSWREFPAENWIVLSRDEQLGWLPPAAARAGFTWTLDPRLSRKILTYFYPQTEDPDSTDRNQFLEQSLQLRALSPAMARIDGQLLMKRSFYPGRADLTLIRARLIGFVRIDPRRRTIADLQLVTHQAFFGEEEFGVAAARHGSGRE